jgi:hypothetical protein
VYRPHDYRVYRDHRLQEDESTPSCAPVAEEAATLAYETVHAGAQFNIEANRYRLEDPYCDHTAAAVLKVPAPAGAAPAGRGDLAEALRRFEAAANFSRGARDYGNLGMIQMQMAELALETDPHNAEAIERLAAAASNLKKAKIRVDAGGYDMTNQKDPRGYRERVVATAGHVKTLRKRYRKAPPLHSPIKPANVKLQGGW